MKQHECERVYGLLHGVLLASNGQMFCPSCFKEVTPEQVHPKHLKEIRMKRKRYGD